MKNEFLIPGMFIAREDIQRIFEEQMKLSNEEAYKRASALTDGQMEDLASAFASEFFDVRDGMFHEILMDAMVDVQKDYDMHKSIYEDA